MSKQVITLSDRAAKRVKEIMASAKEPIIGSLAFEIISLTLSAALSLNVITCLLINLIPI